MLLKLYCEVVELSESRIQTLASSANLCRAPFDMFEVLVHIELVLDGDP